MLDRDGCLETLHEAIAVMAQIPPNTATTQTFIEVVDLFLRIGSEDDAQRVWELVWETAETTPEPAVSFTAIARRCLLSGDVPAAIEAANRIPEEFRQYILESIAETQATQGKIDLAMETAGSILEPAKRRSAYTDIAKIVADRGDIDGSIQILNRAGLSIDGSMSLSKLRNPYRIPGVKIKRLWKLHSIKHDGIWLIRHVRPWIASSTGELFCMA